MLHTQTYERSLSYSNERLGLRSVRSTRWLRPQLWALLTFSVTASGAQACLAPPRPFVPADPSVESGYAEIIRAEFEDYFTNVQKYFRCLDAERARLFDEARDVSGEYENFLRRVGSD